MKSSNGNIFSVTGHLCGEFTGPGEFPAQRPVTRSFDVFFDLRPNKRLSKQWRGWWFETQSRSLWRHRNDKTSWWSVNIGSGNEWLGAIRQQGITQANIDSDICHHMASLNHSELYKNYSLIELFPDESVYNKSNNYRYCVLYFVEIIHK